MDDIGLGMMGSQEEPPGRYRSRQMRGSSLVDSTTVGEIGIHKNDLGSPSLKIFFFQGMDSPGFQVLIIVRSRSQVWRHNLLLPGKYAGKLEWKVLVDGVFSHHLNSGSYVKA